MARGVMPVSTPFLHGKQVTHSACAPAPTDTEFVHGNGPGPGPEGGVRGSTGSDPLMQHAAGGMFGGLNSAVECQVYVMLE